MTPITSHTIVSGHGITLVKGGVAATVVTIRGLAGEAQELVDVSTFPTFDDAHDYVGYVVAQVERGDFPPNEDDE